MMLLMDNSVVVLQMNMGYSLPQERKTFDEKFIRMDTKKLCELTSAADSLQLKPLVDLTSRALARIIEGKTPEEIRETFHLPDDLTEVCPTHTQTLRPQHKHTHIFSSNVSLRFNSTGGKAGALTKHNR